MLNGEEGLKNFSSPHFFVFSDISRADPPHTVAAGNHGINFAPVKNVLVIHVVHCK